MLTIGVREVVLNYTAVVKLIEPFIKTALFFFSRKSLEDNKWF